MKFLIPLIVIAFLQVGCSTKWGKFFSKEENNDARNKELLKSFEVDKEVLDKFAENKPAIKETKKESAKATSKKEVPKKVTSKQASRKNIKPDQKKYQALNKSEKEEEPSPFPEDYPETLIKINKSAKSVWNLYTPLAFENEEIIMDINYLGVSTGKIILKTKPKTMLAGKEAYHFNARLKTSRYYSYLYELDDNIDSYITSDSHLPLKFSLIQRESSQDVDDLQLFDHENLTTYTFYQRKTKDKDKKKKTEAYIPEYFQDPLSVIHFVRGLPMKDNARYDVPVVNKGEVNIMHFKVMHKEKIETSIGEKEAWKVMANTEYTGDKLKKGNMYFWFTADERRIFLKFNAKISIGTISGDIERYSP